MLTATNNIFNTQRTQMPNKLSIKVEQSPISFQFPPTPPCSSSEESEDNQVTTTASVRKTNGRIMVNHHHHHHHQTSTRQPIHTPLISSQPVSLLFKILKKIFRNTTTTIEMFIFFAERIDWYVSIDRRREKNVDSGRLPGSNTFTVDESGREIAEEDQAENKKQGKREFDINCSYSSNRGWSMLIMCFVQISAQESRRKKKEYMDQLERKVEILVSENNDYRKKIENLEDTNSNLMGQLAKLQAIVAKTQRQTKWIAETKGKKLKDKRFNIILIYHYCLIYIVTIIKLDQVQNASNAIQKISLLITIILMSYDVQLLLSLWYI